jgi:hypothetical protein
MKTLKLDNLVLSRDMIIKNIDNLSIDQARGLLRQLLSEPTTAADIKLIEANGGLIFDIDSFKTYQYRAVTRSGAVLYLNRIDSTDWDYPLGLCITEYDTIYKHNQDLVWYTESGQYNWASDSIHPQDILYMELIQQ